MYSAELIPVKLCSLKHLPSAIAFEISLFPHNVPLPPPLLIGRILGGSLHFIHFLVRYRALQNYRDEDLGWEDMKHEMDGLPSLDAEDEGSGFSLVRFIVLTYFLHLFIPRAYRLLLHSLSYFLLFLFSTLSISSRDSDSTRCYCGQAIPTFLGLLMRHTFLQRSPNRLLVTTHRSHGSSSGALSLPWVTSGKPFPNWLLYSTNQPCRRFILNTAPALPKPTPAKPKGPQVQQLDVWTPGDAELAIFR